MYQLKTRTWHTKAADLIPKTQTNKSPPSDILNMVIELGKHAYDASLETHAAVPKVHGEKNDDHYSL